MADITRAFENLNRSLRHISDSNRLAKQAERDHEQKMAVLQEKLNDPRAKLAKQQAEAALAPTEISTPIGMPNTEVDKIFSDKLVENFNNNVLYKKGAEYRNGKIYRRGTNVVFTEPAWQAKQTQNDLAMLSIAGAMPSNRKKVEYATLEQEIKNMKLKKGDISPVKLQAIQRKEKRLEKMKSTATDPIEMRKSIANDRIHLKGTMQQALSLNRMDVAKRIGDMLEMNLKEDIALGKTNTPKDMKGFQYSTKLPNGDINTFTLYRYPGEKINQIEMLDGNRYVLGKLTEGKGTKGSTADVKSKLDIQAKRTSAIKKHTDLRMDLEAVKVDMDIDDYLNQYVKANRGTPEQGKLNFERLMATADSAHVKDMEERLLNMEDAHEGEPWFWKYRKGSFEDFKARQKDFHKKYGGTPTSKKKQKTVKSTFDNPGGLDRKALGLD